MPHGVEEGLGRWGVGVGVEGGLIRQQGVKSYTVDYPLLPNTHYFYTHTEEPAFQTDTSPTDSPHYPATT